MGRGREWAKTAAQYRSVLFHGSSCVRKSSVFRFWLGEILKPHKSSTNRCGLRPVGQELTTSGRSVHVVSFTPLQPDLQFFKSGDMFKHLSTGKISPHPYLHGLSLRASGCISHHSTTPPVQSRNIFIILLSNGCLRATFTLSFYLRFVFASFRPFTLSFQSRLFISH